MSREFGAIQTKCAGHHCQAGQLGRDFLSLGILLSSHNARTPLSTDSTAERPHRSESSEQAWMLFDVATLCSDIPLVLTKIGQLGASHAGAFDASGNVF